MVTAACFLRQEQRAISSLFLIDPYYSILIIASLADEVPVEKFGSESDEKKNQIRKQKLNMCNGIVMSPSHSLYVIAMHHV
jgi:hypothetical protein